MITLITGAPGAGKTAALVSMLEDLGKGRAVYTNGIPQLTLDHLELDDPEKWMSEVPDGSVICIDEVQRIWRPRGPGKKVPDDVAALETHRHRGLDFYIITQGPNLVDANVRALVGRHVHLRELGILGRWWYEWPECNDSCRTAWRGAPIKKRYKLDKKIFGSYKSASQHIKPKRSVPVMVFVAVGALVATASLGWYSYRSVYRQVHPEKLAALPGAQASGTVGGVQGAQMQAPPKVVDERVDFIPRLSDRPWTAPAYDHLRAVVAMPQIAGGICKGSECVCYDAQAVRLDVSKESCAAWINNPPFNPYRAPETAGVSSPYSAGQSAPPHVPSAGARPGAAASARGE